MALSLKIASSLSGAFQRIRNGQICGCASCGECCIRFSGVLMVCDSDVARWKAQGREDLLERIGPAGKIWYSPAGKTREKVCPFLKIEAPGHVLCSIHETKPFICKAYPGAYQGFRCARGFSFDVAREVTADRPLIA